MFSIKHSVTHKYQENLREKLKSINEKLKITPHIELGPNVCKNPLFFTKQVFSFFHQKGYQFRGNYIIEDHPYSDFKKGGLHIINPYFEKPHFLPYRKSLELPKINLDDSLFQKNMIPSLEEEIFKTIETPKAALSSRDLILEKYNSALFNNIQQCIQSVKMEDLNHLSVNIGINGLLDTSTFLKIEKELLKHGYMISSITDYHNGSGIMELKVNQRFVSCYLIDMLE